VKDYHPYVFDIQNRKFVGKFEDMYKADMNGDFDSWHQDDLRDMSKRLSHVLLSDYNFKSVLDIGCGKAQNTQFFKKKNNKVFGVDISESALKIAKSKFSDIFFKCQDLTDSSFSMSALIKEAFDSSSVDLIVCLEVLSYINNWETVLSDISETSNYSLCGLFIPDDPIGFVKSESEFYSVFEQNFNVIEFLHLKKLRHVIAFGASNKIKGK
jgi:SAM-dependent methyltransferase